MKLGREDRAMTQIFGKKESLSGLREVSFWWLVELVSAVYDLILVRSFLLFMCCVGPHVSIRSLLY